MDGVVSCSNSINRLMVLGDLPRFDELPDDSEGLEDGEIGGVAGSSLVHPPSSKPLPGVGVNGSYDPVVNKGANCWNGQRSFVEVVNNVNHSIDLDIAAMVDGVLTIEDKVFDEMCKEWVFTVRDKANFPFGYHVFEELIQTWVVGLLRLFRIGSCKEEFLIKLSNEADYSKVLAKGSIVYNGIGIRFQTYDPLAVGFTDFPKVPVWIALPELSPILYHKDIFECIGAGFGKLVKVDRFTAKKLRLEEARLCVELNLLAPMLDEIVINSVIGVVTQSVKYLNVPKFCSLCHCLGHVSDVCLLPPKKRKEWRVKRVSNGLKEQATVLM